MALDFASEFMITQSSRIVDCYEQATKQSLRERLDIADELSDEKLAKALYEAPQAILSHDVVFKGGERDNIYNYANQMALKVFERSFEEQVALPSSKSTLNSNQPQADRNNILAQCLAQGWVKFDTVRYSSTGKEVILRDAILFNLFDLHGIYCGQAVVFEPVNT